MKKVQRNIVFIAISATVALLCGKAYLDRINQRETEAFEVKTPVTLEKELKKEGIPLLFQMDARWKNQVYGNGTIEFKGCGPTCLSMVAAGLLRDESLTPIMVSKKSEEWGYIEGNSGTSWQLMTTGAREFGLVSKEIPLSEKKIKEALDLGKPVIFAMGPGDFTDEGHFIVITGYEKEGFTVNDPNSKERSRQKWSYERIESQIRNIWSFEILR